MISGVANKAGSTPHTVRIQRWPVDSGLIFEHPLQIVRPKDAARFWEIKPSADAGGKIAAMTAGLPVTRLWVIVC